MRALCNYHDFIWSDAVSISLMAYYLVGEIDPVAHASSTSACGAGNTINGWNFGIEFNTFLTQG